jgi:hypothetical protein
MQQKLSKLAWAVTVLTSIWEVLSPNLGYDTNYPEQYCDIPQFLEQTQGQYVTLGHHWLLPHLLCSLFILTLPFHTPQSQMTTASLSKNLTHKSSIATMLPIQSSNAGCSTRFFSSTNLPGWLYASPSLMFNGYCGAFPMAEWPQHEVDHSYLVPRSESEELYL